jgi:hypothetical protein
MLSERSLCIGSIMASIRTLIPPDQAQIKGASKTNSRNKFILALFSNSSDDSVKVTNVFAKNLGKFLGDTSIHCLISFKH